MVLNRSSEPHIWTSQSAATMMLTFADNFGPFDSALAAFASDLGRLVLADIDRPTFSPHLGTAEKRDAARGSLRMRSAHESRARLRQFERPIDAATSYSGRHHRTGQGRSVTRAGHARDKAHRTGSTISSEQYPMGWETAMVEIRKALVRFAEASGLELSGNGSVSEG